MLDERGIIAGLLVLLLVGCTGRQSDQPELGNVTGVVTLDGTPLVDVTVTFSPLGGGRLSSGTTDEFGRYTLNYTVRATGAKIGKHKVMISETVGVSTRNASKIPEKYNSQSELEVEVVPGENEIPFDLTSS